MRLFFALWPDAQAAAKLSEASDELARLAGGKPVPEAKIHLTLAFLGDVEDAALEAARQAPEDIHLAPFEVVLDQVGSFRGAGVAWAGCREPSRELLALHAALCDRVRRLGFALEERAYTPHVTLARKVTRAVARRQAEAIRWQATEFVLVRTELGKGSYSIVARWKLG